MCWVLYLAADRPLPLHPFDPRAPAFNVATPDPRENAVQAQFHKPFVYSVGAHTCCGCGFDRDQANPNHPEEIEATEESLRALRRYLGEALRIAGPVELYACWDGDQAAEPDQRWQRALADFTADMIWFPDRTFIQVMPEPT